MPKTRGGVAERSIAPDCKSGVFGLRRFKSFSLHQALRLSASPGAARQNALVQSLSGVAGAQRKRRRTVMWYVYILQSKSSPDQRYTGATEDLKQRVRYHNAGQSKHTAKYAPWELVWYCAFPDKYLALEFEKYLKSHSGRAFASKRLFLKQPKKNT